VSYSGLALHIWECLGSDFDIEADNPDRFWHSGWQSHGFRHSSW